MSAPKLPAPPAPPSARRAMLGAALALLGAGSVIAFVASRRTRLPAPAKGAFA
jgi:hypothetical protein